MADTFNVFLSGPMLSALLFNCRVELAVTVVKHNINNAKIQLSACSISIENKYKAMKNLPLFQHTRKMPIIFFSVC